MENMKKTLYETINKAADKRYEFGITQGLIVAMHLVLCADNKDDAFDSLRDMVDERLQKGKK